MSFIGPKDRMGTQDTQRVSESSRRGNLFDRADFSYGEDVDKAKANVIYLRYPMLSKGLWCTHCE